VKRRKRNKERTKREQREKQRENKERTKRNKEKEKKERKVVDFFHSCCCGQVGFFKRTIVLGKVSIPSSDYSHGATKDYVLSQ
jgi:hypothetical protein